jgi:hypothetical protein
VKSSIENLLSDQLQGLLLPPSQDSDSGIYLLLGCATLCVGLLTILRWKQHRNTAARIAIKQIKVLQNEWNANPENRQVTAVQLAHLVREGLQITRLDTYLPQDTSSWNRFLKALDVLCYAPNKVDDTSEELTQVIQESLDWLSAETLK